MTEEEIKRFILETGEEIQQITARITQHTIDQLATSGFRDVALNANAFFSEWELEMTHGKNPPTIAADEVERTVRAIVKRLGWSIKDDLIVTVVLGGQIKSRFFLSQAGQAGAA